MKVLELERNNNKTEKKFIEKMTAEGNYCLRSGWPDFLIFNPNGQIKFIEVKSSKDKLSTKQFQLLTILNDLGMDVGISDGDGNYRQLKQNEIDKGHLLLWEKAGIRKQILAGNVKPDLNWINDLAEKRVKPYVKQIIKELVDEAISKPEEKKPLTIVTPLMPLKNSILPTTKKTASDENLTYSIKEACKLLGISKNLGYELVKKEQFPGAIKIGKKRIIISKNKLNEYIKGESVADEHESA